MLHRRVLLALVALVLWTVGDRSNGQAGRRLDLLVYGSPIDYHQSVVKTRGWLVGGYGYLGLGRRHGFEASLARTHIGYVDSTKLDQTDVTAAYAYFGDKVRWRLGGHLVNSDDSLTNRTPVLFGGVALYRPYNWSLGVDASYSDYAHYLVPLHVVQISPALSWTLGEAARLRYLFVEVKGHYIRLSQDIGIGEMDLFSMESSVSFIQDGWVVSAFLWSGEQIFAVRTSGFTVFNLPEKHTGGYGGSVKRLLNEHASLTLSVHHEQFRDIGYSEDVSLLLIQLSCGVSI